MSKLETKAMASQGTPYQEVRKSDIRPGEREDLRDGDRHENAAKYREKVDELNRSRDVDIERALTLRAGR